MSQLLTQFVSLLKAQNSHQLTNFFKDLSQQQQTEVLLFLNAQAAKNDENFNYFQLLSIKLMAQTPFPKPLIALIKNCQLINFFTPLLKQMANFSVTDEQQRNVLHHLFVARGESTSPPFNYVKSLLLFESNLFLPKALGQQEHTGLTPIEAYLQLNIQGKVLAKHELTSFLGLTEITQQQTDIKPQNCDQAIKRFKKQNQDFALSSDYIAQKKLLLASFYKININDINLTLSP